MSDHDARILADPLGFEECFTFLQIQAMSDRATMIPRVPLTPLILTNVSHFANVPTTKAHLHLHRGGAFPPWGGPGTLESPGVQGPGFVAPPEGKVW